MRTELCTWNLLGCLSMVMASEKCKCPLNSGSQDSGFAIYLLAHPSALLSWSQGIWYSHHLEEYTVDCREEVTGRAESNLLASASLCLQWDVSCLKSGHILGCSVLE